MKSKFIVIFIFFSTIISCSNKEDTCKCNEYLKSSNGSLTLYGEASSSFCDGTLPNPSPQITIYKEDCN